MAGRDAMRWVAPAPIGTVPALPRRRRTGLAALGVLMVVAGAVIAYLVFNSATATSSYLLLARDVAYGHPITASDLTTVSLAASPGLTAIPAADRAQVMGKDAATDLYAGTLLSLRDVAAKAVPAPGQEVLGLELKPSQLPSSVERGDAVLLAIVPSSSVGGLPDDQTGSEDTTTVAATVAADPESEQDGNVRVDVAVDAAAAPQVAAMSAAGRIVLIVMARG